MHIGGEKRTVCPCRPPLPKKQAQIATGFQDLRAFRLGRLFGRAVFHQLDAEHQTFAANVANDVVFFLQPNESGGNVVAHLERISLQLFALDHFENGLSLRADDRIAAEGVEMNPLRVPPRSSAWSRPRLTDSHCRFLSPCRQYRE